MTIVLRGPVYEPNSHGGSIRSLAVALMKAGVPVRTTECNSGIWDNYVLKSRKEDAEILKACAATQVQPRQYWLIQHVVPHQFVFDPQAARNVGYATFETDSLPGEWLIPMQAMDEVWTASFQNIEAFRQGGCRREVKLVPHGYDPTIYSVLGENVFSLNLPPEIVKFGCCFDWTPRKNGLRLIESYFEAFRDQTNVALVMKLSMNRGKLEALKKVVSDMRQTMKLGELPKIVLLPDYLPEWYMGSFYRQLDCFVSLSHGEGFCKPVIEAMACGVPCLVSGWGGQMDFCNADNSLFIADSPLGPVPEEQIQHCGTIYTGQNWCYPNHADVVENMRWFFKNRDTDAVKRLAANALATAQAYTWDNVAAHIKELVYAAH